MSFALEPNAPVSTRSAREHYLDALRAGLMLVGIPYHAAYVYTGRPWFVACSHRSHDLRIFGDIIHLFRMQAFFLVAGIFAAYLLVRRTPGAYLKGRLVRLGIPLVAVAVLVNPMGPVFHQIVRVLQDKEQASAALRMAIFQPRMDHLWFLLVLIYFSAVAAVVFALRRTTTSLIAVEPTIDRYMILVLFATCGIVGLYQWLTHQVMAPIDARYGVVIRALQIDRAVEYAPYFALGVLLGRSARANAAMVQPRLPLLIAAIVAVCATLPLVDTNARGLEMTASAQLISAFPALLCTQALLSLARRYGSKPSPLVQVLARASFTMYLLHFPIIIVFQETFVALGTAIPVAFVVTTIAVSFISFATWAFSELRGFASFAGAWFPQRQRD